jgi:hypothetical protein
MVQTVKNESVIRFREMMRIEDEREPLMRGMVLLINVHAHLKNDSPESEESASAMEQIVSLIGPMEDSNKSLSEKQDELWRAILAVDGPELSSREIEKERVEVALGMDWLNRTCRRVDENCPVDDRGRDALNQLAELHAQLSYRESALRQSQYEHQMAQAEILASRANLYEN